MLGKIEGRRRSGRKRLRWLDGIIDSMDMSLSKLWEILKYSVASGAAVHGVTRFGHDLVTEQQQKKCLKPVDTKFCRRTLQHYVTERSGILIFQLILQREK